MYQAYQLLSQGQKNYFCLFAYAFIQLSMVKAQICPNRIADHLLTVLKITTTASLAHRYIVLVPPQATPSVILEFFNATQLCIIESLQV